jgi:uncharacterized protein involved in exopolysaccharide biosynthesis
VIRRATIAWITAAAIIVALVLSLCMTPKYAAESHVALNPANSAALDVPGGGDRLRRHPRDPSQDARE